MTITIALENFNIFLKYIDNTHILYKKGGFDVKNNEPDNKSSVKHNSAEEKHIPNMENAERFLKTAENWGNAFTRLNQIAEPVISMAQQIAEQLKPFFDAIHSIDWKKVEEKWIQVAGDIGEKGWTIPIHFSINDLFKVAELDEQNEVDKVFMQFFADEKNYSDMKQNIMENDLLKKFHPLLEQCFENYEKEQYLIVIPSLFSVVEGLAHKLIYPPYRETFHHKSGQRANIIAKYEKMRDEIESNSSNAAIYISATLFLSKSFDNKNAFNDEAEKDSRPLIINRNRVLHGRDDISLWRKADAIRLFNALHTLSILDLDENEL